MADARVKKDKKTGKWFFRLRYKDTMTQKWKGINRSGYRTKSEGEAALKRLEHEIDLGFDQTADETLKEYLSNWFKEYREHKVAKNTYMIDKFNIETRIIPYFQNVKLKNVTPAMYQKFINHLIIDRGFSKQTTKLTHTTMYMAIKRAVKPLRKIQSNFCEDVVIETPREQKEKNKVKFIDYDQVPAFLQTAKKDNLLYYMFFCHLIQTGMRKGEAGGLQWSQVDLSNQRINIIQTLDYSEDLDSPELFGDTKTYKSAREIPITNWWTMQLNAHRVRQNDNRMRFGEDYRQDLDLVFAREDGTPIPKSTLFNAFRRICRKTDIPIDLDIHSLRHTAAVLLLESGAEMKYIQEILGHGSMQVTADVYSHVSHRIERSSLNKFEEYTRDVFGS